MIVKFVCDDGSLRIFETGEISYISGDPIVDPEEFKRLYEAIKLGDYQTFAGTPESYPSDPDIEGQIIPFKVIQFMDEGGKERTVLFDNIVYICNNQGRTVDTITAFN